MSDSSSVAPVAGDHAVLARRYAGALFALAEESGSLDAVAADLSSLKQLWQESADWRSLASDPRLSQSALATLVSKVAEMAGTGDLTGRFLALVAQKRRLALLPAFIAEFSARLSARRGEYDAEIRVARPLSVAQRDTLQSSLNSVAGGQVRMAVVQDASILGGLTVKLGTKFIDASVKTKLDLMERQLKGAA